MFKSASENAQLRTRRVALDSRNNTAGIDPDVFKPELDRELTTRERLVQRKLELEGKISNLRNQMAVATSRRRNNLNGQIDDNTFQRLATEFNNLRQEVRRIDLKMLNMRVDAKVMEEKRQLSKAEVFVQVAREMLADPIFKTLMKKAVERLDGNG